MINNGFPKSLFCIIITEFCERFSFCGLRTILSLYLRNILLLPENAATVTFHLFIMLCYLMPTVGAILADSCIGRYRTILYFCVVYLLGNILLCLSAIPIPGISALVVTLSGLAVTAAGTGGIKPCVAAFGGDQFRLPEQKSQLGLFFSIFYFVINVGGMLGMIIAPFFKKSFTCFGADTCYALGFGFPILLIVFGIGAFISGSSSYRKKKPKTNLLSDFIRCIRSALRGKRRRKDLQHQRQDHWLDYALETEPKRLVMDVKAALAIFKLYLSVPVFWSLFDQQGSSWTFQASRMRGDFFGFQLTPDQLQVMNPFLVLMMIPFCPGGILPIFSKLFPLDRMLIGGILAAVSFVMAGILQIHIEEGALEPPGFHKTALIAINILDCPVVLEASEKDYQEKFFVDPNTINHSSYFSAKDGMINLKASVQDTCSLYKTKPEEKTVSLYPKMQTVVILDSSQDNELQLYEVEPTEYAKSLTGKPKLKIAFVSKSRKEKNVRVIVSSGDMRFRTIYFIPNHPVKSLTESDFIYLEPPFVNWKVKGKSLKRKISGRNEIKYGGVYLFLAIESKDSIKHHSMHAICEPNTIHMLWIVPQYVLLSIAEVMFGISGIEFAFTQSPKYMKTITIAAWYITVAVGNLIVIIITELKIFDRKAHEYFFFAILLMLDMVLFGALARDYESRPLDDDGSSVENLDDDFRQSIIPAGYPISVSQRVCSKKDGCFTCLPIGHSSTFENDVICSFDKSDESETSSSN